MTYKIKATLIIETTEITLCSDCCKLLFMTKGKLSHSKPRIMTYTI